MKKKDLDFVDRLEQVKNDYMNLYKDIPKAMSVKKSGLLSATDIQECLVQGTFIAGSSFYNIYHKLSPSIGDIDFFFKDEESPSNFENYFLLAGLTPTKKTSNPYGADDASENDFDIEKDEFLITDYSIKMNLNPYSKSIINLVKLTATEKTRGFKKEVVSPIDILDTFDYAHTRVFYDPLEESINMPDKTKFCIENKVLAFSNRYLKLLFAHTEIKPSLSRAKKFIKRGMRMDDKTLEVLKNYHGDNI